MNKEFAFKDRRRKERGQSLCTSGLPLSFSLSLSLSLSASMFRLAGTEEIEKRDAIQMACLFFKSAGIAAIADAFRERDTMNGSRSHIARGTD
jgi:hypothetical protein